MTKRPLWQVSITLSLMQKLFSRWYCSICHQLSFLFWVSAAGNALIFFFLFVSRLARRGGREEGVVFGLVNVSCTSKSQFAMGPAIQRGRYWVEKSAERTAQLHHRKERGGLALSPSSFGKLFSQQAKNKSSALFFLLFCHDVLKLKYNRYMNVRESILMITHLPYSRSKM